MIKAVVFDMDGVLFDTERISRDIFFQTAREMGLDIPKPAFMGLLGLNAVDGAAFFRSEMEKVYPGGGFPHEAFSKKRSELYAAALEKELPLKAGVREILEFLKRKDIRLAVASSTAENKVRANLRRHDLLRYFDSIVTGDMVLHSKPRPDIYLKACEALGVCCHDAVAVEDSPSGICAAHTAGMYTVMVPDLVEPSADLQKRCSLICRDLLALKDDLEEVLE